MPAGIRTRPDGRRFISLIDITSSDYEAWLRAATQTSRDSLYLHCSGDDQAMLAAATNCGFTTETIAKVYRVPFSPMTTTALGSDQEQHIEIVPADQVNQDALFRLDECIRRDVPGLDGWVGHRGWFDQELASAEFDSSGYLVARHRATEQQVGLVRFWHHPEMPKLGLLGVLPGYRGRHLSYRLMSTGLHAARRWGHSHFETHTARPSLQRRLERLGAVETGTHLQMVSERR